MDHYAKEGLRTLLLTKKELNSYDYGIWNQKFEEANKAIYEREEKVAKVSAELEVDLDLVGATAIEDKLQDEVAETIQALKSAGIQVWVLTGDKVETAINIGFSAGLLDSTMEIFEITLVDYN